MDVTLNQTELKSLIPEGLENCFDYTHTEQGIKAVVCLAFITGQDMGTTD